MSTTVEMLLMCLIYWSSEKAKYWLNTSIVYVTNMNFHL